MNQSRQRFLCPHARYYGPLSPEQLTFNANLQDFAHQVGYISNLHTGGKLSSDDAFEQISHLWKTLEQSKP